MSEWKEIGSAPRDGTTVDLWTSEGRIPDCKWSKPRGCWVNWWMSNFSQIGWQEVDWPPTHWMPTPEPPTDATH